ncbi:DUF3253 domain-containing protein [Ruficoccus amylovorans]|uniref:DUF3253 domain-containing protein n=1 Tax=Ruficoccus amylovorans TaxID=1804625 RepID=A0A842HHZ4_9BACT|nr:DUF3253 domain-containing protein [Ruficoccus amylovorans]MBC2596032.1 DUF3253 domain-containing protein [Ruficoccus amylovorans]
MDEAKMRRVIFGVTRERGESGTACPSDAARKISPYKWRALMPQIIGAARRMAADGEIVMVQNGQPVDPATAKGAFRLRLPPGKF